MDEGQLDGVGDLLDLAVQTADVLVGNIGHLFEHELLDLGPGQHLEQQPRARVLQNGVTGADLATLECVRQLGHTLLVGSTQDHGPIAVVQQLLERDQFTGHFGGTGQHHVQRFVEDDLGPTGEVRLAEVGVDRHPHLAATGEHVHSAVVITTQERAVSGRRLGQLLDLVTQGGDVLACLAQGVGELFVLGYGLRQLPLRLEQPLLERSHPLGGVLQTPAQRDDLFFQRDRLVAQLGHLCIEGSDPLLILGFVDENHLLERSSRTIHRPFGDAAEALGFAANGAA